MQQAHLLRQPFVLARGDVVAGDDRLGGEARRRERHDRVERVLDERTGRLQHEHRSVAVEHQPRQPVGLTVHEPRALFGAEPGGAPFERRGQPFGEERLAAGHAVVGPRPAQPQRELARSGRAEAEVAAGLVAHAHEARRQHGAEFDVVAVEPDLPAAREAAAALGQAEFVGGGVPFGPGGHRGGDGSARRPRSPLRARTRSVVGQRGAAAGAASGTPLRERLLPSRPASSPCMLCCNARPTSRYGLGGLSSSSLTCELP